MPEKFKIQLDIVPGKGVVQGKIVADKSHDKGTEPYEFWLKLNYPRPEGEGFSKTLSTSSRHSK